MKKFENKLCKILLFFAICMCVSIPLGAAEKPNIKEVLHSIDELYRTNSSYGVIEMEITTAHWNRTLKLRVWTKDTTRTLIRILEPEKERGVGTLRIDNEMWNYLPKTNKVIKIPPSMMMSSWMGSDFNNNDLVSEYTFIDDYNFEYTDVDNPEANTLYIKCVPKKGRPIVWGYIIIAVQQESFMPFWQEYYSENGELMRTMSYKKIKEFDGRKIPSVIELVPHNKKGNKTVITYLELQFNTSINNDIFTLRKLRKF